MSVSTLLSIGWMIKGMEANPTIVGIIFPNLCLILESLIPFPTAQQMRLIVKPGIATDARSCQVTTSPATIKDFFTSPDFLNSLLLLSYVSAKTYPIAMT